MEIPGRIEGWDVTDVASSDAYGSDCCQACLSQSICTFFYFESNGDGSGGRCYFKNAPDTVDILDSQVTPNYEILHHNQLYRKLAYAGNNYTTITTTTTAPTSQSGKVTW